uniref:Shikimate dehydrogenase (NADP(+)) n=1 Tax=Odontella aurita TaxID=265563 RepID=A0A7S4MW89_9STRA|mmetsp:Transcript_36407/g.109301  ORF Transcript_36407/g.109301 Transcript_36407/m.109301 type:complete len:912 (+) Transcript_36407:168-2903(+)
MNLLSRGALSLALLTAAASSFSVGSTFGVSATATAARGADHREKTCRSAGVVGERCRGSTTNTALHVASAPRESKSTSEGEGGLDDDASTIDASSSASSSAEPEPRNRNIFQSGAYDRPIVLMGCSGPGDELMRLARSLSEKLGGSGGVGGSGPGRGVVEAWSLGGSAETTRMMDRSDVVVVDFSRVGAADEEQHQLVEFARSLHEDEGLLGVYVNVHPDHGRLSEDAVAAKGALESEVFVPYTNYEICIKNEGVRSVDNAEAADGEEEEEEEAILEDGSNFVSPDGWDGAEWELSRLVARATLPPTVPGATYEPGDLNCADINMGKHTFFLSLSFPHVLEASPYLEAMCLDVDAMEYRADLIAARDDRFELSYQLQTLRRMCRPHTVRSPRLPLAGRGGIVLEDSIPIVYTVRTAHQAGTYPDDEEGIRRMFDMLRVGLRSGVEVCDVESAWDPTKTDSLLSLAEERYATQILGSHHVVGRESSMEEAVGFYRQCHLDGRAHGAKVVLSVDDDSKDAMALDAGLLAQSLCRTSGRPVVPNVALLLGEAGQYSRILNTRFTPVTHESLPFVAAPGQLTANEIMATRLVMGRIKPLKFGILGHNIAYSVSPAMHGAAFSATKLPHSYDLLDMEDVAELVGSDFWNGDDFGGLSVTIPHKQNIMPFMDELSDSVADIGAMNTVIVVRDDDSGERRLRGDNTDWRGIHGPLERRLGPKPKPSSSSDSVGGEGRGIALILGGGGTARAAAYAARELGLDRVYWNRTPSKARELAESFGGVAITSLDESPSEGGGSTLGDALFLADVDVPAAIISTLPAAAGFEIPRWLMDRSKTTGAQRPVVFDVNYKPYDTPLLLQAEGAGFDVVRGSEMLWEQGVGQFELWTGRTAPYGVMRGVVLENCLPPLPPPQTETTEK